MSARDGHIELDRAVESIVVGHRHRVDLGDLENLVASIADLGMLQPITVSPDGTLICGARRLEAAKRLGFRRVNVWVRSGISTRLRQLLAEQHDNTTRKPFTPIEAAGLYRELRTLMAEDAARRQHATRFGNRDGVIDETAGGDSGNGETAGRAGAAESAAPQVGDSRAQAARLVTGRNSYSMLEQVGQLQRLADDPATPQGVREAAAAALAGITVDGKVHSHYQEFQLARAARRAGTIGGQDAQDPLDAQRQAELAVLASEALARVRDSRRTGRASGAAKPRSSRRRGVRAFVLTWAELSGWAALYDPGEIGPALSDAQWAGFTATVEATVAFADAARTARQAHAA